MSQRSKYIMRKYYTRAEKLRNQGYRWEYDARGYQVWYKAEFISGARIRRAAPEPRGWNAHNNRLDNFVTCVRTAEAHKSKNE